MKINPLEMKPLLLPKMMINTKKVNKIKMMIKIMRWTMINGELSKIKIKMINTSQNNHHSLIQGLGKPFNVIIQSITFLVS
jgi:hypothetical protein